MHLCTKTEKQFTITIFYMYMILILRFETEILVTCISSFNFLFFLLFSNFSRGLFNVEGCDNAALCCSGKDEDAAGCRSDSVKCVPAILCIHII